MSLPLFLWLSVERVRQVQTVFTKDKDSREFSKKYPSVDQQQTRNDGNSVLKKCLFLKSRLQSKPSSQTSQ